MSRRVVRIVEHERQRLPGIRRLQHLAKLAGNPLRADDLEIGRAARARAATRKVGRRAAPDHVLIDFADDRINRYGRVIGIRSEEHTSELQSLTNLVCRLLLEKKKKQQK